MVRYFQKIPPLKKILQLEDRTCFFIKNTKNKHSLASEWWGNSKSGCKENARTVSKNYTTREKIKILRLKKDCETYIKKRNFKPEIKPMIEIWQDELYQLENKRGKVDKVHANFR